MEKTKQKVLQTLWQACHGEASLHRHDGWQMIALMAGVACFFCILMSIIGVVAGDVDWQSEVAMIAVIGCLVVAWILGLILTGNYFSVYFKLGVQMGQTRRGMIARMTVLSCVVYGITLLFVQLLSWGANGVQTLFGVVPLDWQSEIPAAGWVLIILLPITGGVWGASILVRFGRSGFWVLYGCFILLVFGGQLLPDTMQDGAVNGIENIAAVAQHYPLAVALVALVPYLIGVCLLWRVPVDV